MSLLLAAWPQSKGSYTVGLTDPASKGTLASRFVCIITVSRVITISTKGETMNTRTYWALYGLVVLLGSITVTTRGDDLDRPPSHNPTLFRPGNPNPLLLGPLGSDLYCNVNGPICGVYFAETCTSADGSGPSPITCGYCDSSQNPNVTVQICVTKPDEQCAAWTGGVQVLDCGKWIEGVCISNGTCRGSQIHLNWCERPDCYQL